ncbi:MAG: hypothetical protein ABSF95_14350 [Verrucomicrobiota bacterium]|jgi:hypothetical protein
MIRTTTHYFYDLGTTLHPLGDIRAGAEIQQVIYQLYMAETRLSNLLEQNLIPVKVCRGDAEKLRKCICEIRDRALRTDSKPEDKLITPWDAYQLSDGLKCFEAVLAAELSQMDTYYVSQKGCYSTIHLIEQAELVFPSSIRDLLPADSKIDIRQGGKCLAFELPTAAGFHFLRATESVLHKYYDVISGGKARPHTRNMGKYIEALEKVKGVDPKILAVLKQIKDLHRNPIAHPEAVLDMEEATALLGIVQSAITSMLSVVKRNPPKAEPEPSATKATDPPVVAFATPEEPAEPLAKKR